MQKKIVSKAENGSKRTVQSRQENNRKKPKISDLKPFEEEDHGFVFVRKQILDEFLASNQVSNMFIDINKTSQEPLPHFSKKDNVARQQNVPNYNYDYLTQNIGENSNSSNRSYEIQTSKSISQQIIDPEEENFSAGESLDNSPVPTVSFTLPSESSSFIKPRDSREKGRRTSEKRGKRASSIRDGFLVEPHPDIKTEDFYRHIQPELPNPVKMKQLLIWCAQRTLGTQKHEDEKVLNIVKNIQKDVIKDLSENVISTSWYQNACIKSEHVGKDNNVASKKPHPENLKNQKKLEVLEKTLERLNKENAEWDSLVSGLNSLYDSVSSSDQNNNIMLDEIDFSILPENQLKFLGEDDSVEKKQLEFLEEISKSLEINVDRFYHILYNLSQFNTATGIYCKDLLKKLGEIPNKSVEEHIDLLRAISSLNKQQSS